MTWGPKKRIRPQCRVTTPLWVPGADSGQRGKNEIGGAKFGPKNDCGARPWGRRAVTLVSKSCILVDYTGYSTSDLRGSAVYLQNYILLIMTPQKTPKQKKFFSWGFPALSHV